MVSIFKNFVAGSLTFATIFLLAEISLAQQDHAQTSSEVVNITGRATDPDGKPLRGPATIVLDFFNAEHSDYPFASISRDVTINDGGVFHLPVTSDDLPMLPNELWIQITIGERAPLPRQRILASFFARRAALADSAEGVFKITSPGGGSISLSAPVDLDEHIAIELPISAGEAGEVLASDGAGKLVWQEANGKAAESSVAGANLGPGAGVFAGKQGDTLNFRSIQAGSGISVSQTGEALTISSAGGGDAMLKSTYDKGGSSGVVDNAETLGGRAPEYFTNATNLTTGVVAEARIDPALARDSEIPFKAKSDLVEALSGEYAAARHGHAMSEISGTIGESQIDPAIARLSDVTYRSESDLTLALDNDYSPLSHQHMAEDVTTSQERMFVSSAEKLNWNAATTATGSATSSAVAGSLAKRDENGGLAVSALDIGSSHQVQLSAQPGSSYSLVLPSNPGEPNQVLTTDGSGQLQWLDPSQGGAGLRDSARNLIIQNNPTSPATQLIVKADQVIVASADGASASVGGVDLLMDITIDRTDASLATSAWYHIWLSTDGHTSTGVFSPSSATPPAGSPMAAYLGAVYVQADGSLIRLFQRNKTVLRASAPAVSRGTAAAYAAIDLGAVVPSTAVSIQGEAGLSQDFSVYAQGIFLSPSEDGFGEMRFIQYTESSLTDELAWPFDMMLMSPQLLFYQCYHKLGGAMCTPERANVYVRVKGWKY